MLHNPSTPPARNNAPDAGGDLRAWLDERIAGHDRSLRYCPPGAVRAHEMTAAALREVRDRLPTPDPTPARDERVENLLEQAWGVIANASGGRWWDQSPEWQDAATWWRDAWHEHRGIGPGGPPPHRQTSDDPEGAEAVELAPDSAAARESGPTAGGAS